MDKRYRVGIAGAGAIAHGTAAVLERDGHRATLWAPRRGAALAQELSGGLTCEGAIEGRFHPAVAASAEALAADADVLILALPGYGHKAVMDALAPHVRDGQAIIISSHSAMGAVYLGDLLAARGVKAPIIAWSTTVVLAQRPEPALVRSQALRARVDICTLPGDSAAEGLALCEALFGQRFKDMGGLLAISLSNLNPQNHLGIGLVNLTRMELGETWRQTNYMTPMVARYIEALDQERLAIAEALGLRVRTVREHFHLSYHVDAEADLAAMFDEMRARNIGGTGPTTAQSRYITEDVPFGLVPTVLLGDLVGRPAPLHWAGVDTFCALYGRDFWSECDLMQALDLGRFDRAGLVAVAERGTTAA